MPRESRTRPRWNPAEPLPRWVTSHSLRRPPGAAAAPPASLAGGRATLLLGRSVSAWSAPDPWAASFQILPSSHPLLAHLHPSSAAPVTDTKRTTQRREWAASPRGPPQPKLPALARRRLDLPPLAARTLCSDRGVYAPHLSVFVQHPLLSPVCLFSKTHLVEAAVTPAGGRARTCAAGWAQRPVRATRRRDVNGGGLQRELL